MENRLLAQINEVLSGKGETLLQRLSPEMKLRDDVGFDSFDLAELTVRLEEIYDVDIFENGIVNTVGEVMTLLEKNE